MTGFRLIDDGYSFKKITQGRKWVGRVVKHATEPRYLGIIGKITVSAPTEREAFAEVVASVLGFKSATDLHAANAATRAQNRIIRAHARYAVNQIMQGNFEPFVDALVGKARV